MTANFSERIDKLRSDTLEDISKHLQTKHIIPVMGAWTRQRNEQDTYPELEYPDWIITKLYNASGIPTIQAYFEREDEDYPKSLPRAFELTALTTEELCKLADTLNKQQQNRIEMKATNFDIRISKTAALALLKPLADPYIADGKMINCILDEMDGIEIMCKEYGDDEDWIGMTFEDYETLEEDEDYQTFELWLPARKG